MTPPEPVTALRVAEDAADAGDAQRRHNEGHGRRLTAAFEALEGFPALAESRDRVLRLISDERSNTGEIVAAVEGDVALVIAVLRVANQSEGRSRGRVESIVSA
ncbi:MAG TPA: HDOD domain-containing protein, partial [Solirubrobacteraceae bacterium]|nr:HDOD domain-containing protein [Solirubrobacteraceae bacterium]